MYISKKAIVLCAILLVAIFVLCSCAVGNRGIGFDTKQTFRYANVYLDGEWQDVAVKSWRDFENSDSVQIEIDGNTFYTHLSNVILMEKARKSTGK